MEKLTIIVPCYNEEEVLDDFYHEVKREIGRASCRERV